VPDPNPLPTPTPGPELARRLVDARSVAVVGASARPNSLGAVAIAQLVGGGFPGPVYPVNPRHDTLAGLRCYPALDALPEPADLVLLAVPDGALLEQLELAGACGARAAVVFGGFSRVASDEGEPPFAEQLGAVARRRGLALCGPNGMGFIDFPRRLRAVGYEEPLTRRPGGVSFFSHSGSVFSAILHNRRGLEFDLVVSTGQEAVLSVADFTLHALERDDTTVIGLFLEAVRDGRAFVRGLQRAAEREVPVVALKVGGSAAAGHYVRAHSGALAGDDAAFDAVFDAYGVARVQTLDELMDTLELFSAGRRAGRGGLAAVLDSGGERAHLADLAEQKAVPFARLDEATTRRLAARLEPGLVPANPLDAWGSGRDFEAAYRDYLLALHDEPDTAVLTFAVDLTTEGSANSGYVRVAREVHAATDKPFALLSHVRSGMDPDDAAAVRAAGVPVLEGTATGLAAIRHLLEHRDAMARPAHKDQARPAATVSSRWRRRLATGGAPNEAEALALLRDYGVPVVAHRTAASAPGALAAAEELGWPVVLKTAAPGIAHKTDVGGVKLDLRDRAALQAAYDDVATRLGPQVLLARMQRPAVELALGVVRDPVFGPLLLVAAGGTLVELLRDRVAALPPVDAGGARRLLGRLALSPLLEGARGRRPVDLDAVAAAVASLSTLAEDLGDHVAAIDVNPLLAGPDGCLAVDALVVTAEPADAAALHPATEDAGRRRA
jgi:acetate---CoA ligase (ADP-forming)